MESRIDVCTQCCPIALILKLMMCLPDNRHATVAHFLRTTPTHKGMHCTFTFRHRMSTIPLNIRHVTSAKRGAIKIAT
jgi:hypothetical protein